MRAPSRCLEGAFLPSSAPFDSGWLERRVIGIGIWQVVLTVAIVALVVYGLVRSRRRRPNDDR